MDALHIDIVDDRRLDADVARLLFEVLYREFGIDQRDDWFHAAAGGVLAVARDGDGDLLGVARLLPPAADGSRQLRQVAVAPEAQNRGVGRAVVQVLEESAAAEGARELWLNARQDAFGFYERLGFRADGDMFDSELTGLPHRRMRKALSPGF